MDKEEEGMTLRRADDESYWGKPETDEEQHMVDYVGQQCVWSLFT